MNELILLSTQIHVVSVLLTIMITVFISVIFSTQDDYVKLTKKYERYSLLYFFFLSVTVFTGLVLFTVTGFVWSLKVVLMILAVLHLIATSVKLHIYFKSSRVWDKESQILFKRETRKKFLIDVVVLILIGFISYAIHI